MKYKEIHLHAHRSWSTPTLIFPHSQLYWQITYGCMQSEPPPPGEPPRALLQSGSLSERSTRLSRTRHALTPALCRTSCTQSSIQCSLTQLELNSNEICMPPWVKIPTVWSPVEREEFRHCNGRSFLPISDCSSLFCDRNAKITCE